MYLDKAFISLRASVDCAVHLSVRQDLFYERKKYGFKKR